MNKCLLVHSGNMVVMALLSLLHLSHSANEVERIIYILTLFQPGGGVESTPLQVFPSP